MLNCKVGHWSLFIGKRIDGVINQDKTDRMVILHLDFPEYP